MQSDYGKHADGSAPLSSEEKLTVGSWGGSRHASSKLLCGKLSTNAGLYFWSVPKKPGSPWTVWSPVFGNPTTTKCSQSCCAWLTASCCFSSGLAAIT